MTFAVVPDFNPLLDPTATIDGLGSLSREQIQRRRLSPAVAATMFSDPKLLEDITDFKRLYGMNYGIHDSYRFKRD